jgi:hypothetical protein
MYIKNRFNRDGDIIEDPKTYQSPYAEELKELLNEFYSKRYKNFDQNNN